MLQSMPYLDPHPWPYPHFCLHPYNSLAFLLSSSSLESFLPAPGVAAAFGEAFPVFMKPPPASGVLPGAGQDASSPCAQQEELKEDG